jgi:hypothetical protein
MMIQPPSFLASRAYPIVDPRISYTKTQRVFVWTILYLAEKPSIIAALRKYHKTVSSSGDICVALIDFLDSEENNAENANALYECQGPLKPYWEQSWESIRKTLKIMLDKGTTSISDEHTAQADAF